MMAGVGDALSTVEGSAGRQPVAVAKLATLGVTGRRTGGGL
jgi:hypothetical protein